MAMTIDDKWAAEWSRSAAVIAVPGNPLRHIDVLANPVVVIKHRRRYK
jgi:hypothetical protein